MGKSHWPYIATLGAASIFGLLGLKIFGNMGSHDAPKKNEKTAVVSTDNSNRIFYRADKIGSSVDVQYRITPDNNVLRQNVIAQYERDIRDELKAHGYDKLDEFLTAQLDAAMDNPAYLTDLGEITRKEIFDFVEKHNRGDIRLDYTKPVSAPTHGPSTCYEELDREYEALERAVDRQLELSRKSVAFRQKAVEDARRKKDMLDAQHQLYQSYLRAQFAQR